MLGVRSVQQQSRLARGQTEGVLQQRRNVDTFMRLFAAADELYNVLGLCTVV